MKNNYRCKVCLDTFSLLRYLRKHVTIPAVEDHQPNKCQRYYSRTGNLQENLKVNHRIVPENTPTEELGCKPEGQRVQLISTSNQENKDHSKDDDDCRIIEDEPACLKFEPDEEDALYFFDRDNPKLQINDIASNSLQRFLNTEDQTKKDNLESNFIEDEGQEIGNAVLSVNTGRNSPAETTICKVCKLDCTSLENLCLHYETFHKLPVVVLARVVNNQKNSKFKRTERNYSEEAIRKTKTHKCGICSKTFTAPNSLKRHESSIHDGKIFICNVCPKTFHYMENLTRHKLSAHDGLRYKCNLCEKKFRYSSNLKCHKSSVHDNIRFNCDICQKEFTELGNLKKHKSRIHERLRYKCNNCSKHFSSTQSLRNHQASIHEGVRYKCELCETEFRQESYLKEHKAGAHDGVRYKCDTCPKEYSRKQDLRRHKAVRHKTQRFRAN